MKDKSRKAAAISGAAGTLATGGTLTAVTSTLSGPAAKLGGYATAQIVAKSVGGTIGLNLGGPTLSAGIAAVGGPVVAGILVTGGTALVAGAIGYLGYKGWEKFFG